MTRTLKNRLPYMTKTAALHQARLDVWIERFRDSWIVSRPCMGGRTTTYPRPYWEAQQVRRDNVVTRAIYLMGYREATGYDEDEIEFMCSNDTYGCSADRLLGHVLNRIDKALMKG